MGHDDRAMLLAVLDALPAAAQQADPAIRERLSAAAAWPLRVALRAVHGSRLRRVWRAVRGDVVVP
jgi:hypothetical protein